MSPRGKIVCGIMNKKRKIKEGLRVLELETIPAAIPTGYVLVHNHIPHTINTVCGEDGFRAWMQKPSDDLELCKCGWSGLLHYRIKKELLFTSNQRTGAPVLH